MRILPTVHTVTSGQEWTHDDRGYRLSKIDTLIENLESEAPYVRMQALSELSKIDTNELDEDEAFRVYLISRRLRKDPERAVRQYAMAFLERHGHGRWGTKRAVSKAGNPSGLVAFALNYVLPGAGMLYLGQGWRVALTHFLGAAVIIVVVDRFIALMGLEILRAGASLLVLLAAAEALKTDPELGFIILLFANLAVGMIIYSPVLVAYGWFAKKKADEINGRGRPAPPGT